MLKHKGTGTRGHRESNDLSSREYYIHTALFPDFQTSVPSCLCVAVFQSLLMLNHNARGQEDQEYYHNELIISFVFSYESS